MTRPGNHLRAGNAAARAASLAAVLLLMPWTLSLADDWRGRGRARGVVLDDDGLHLAGATVRLLREDANGPRAITTDAKGRWSQGGLAPGNWRLVIEAPGHVASDGRISIPAEGTGPQIEVRLRSLDEVSPRGSEGNRSTIVTWIDRGHSLLAQGRYAEARAEYERALPELPPPQRAGLMQSVARTWFLEGAIDETYDTLREGLRLAPDHVELRALLAALCREIGDCAERSERFEQNAKTLSALDASEAVAARDLPDHPRLAAKPHLVGRYRTVFETPAAIAAVEEFARRAGYDVGELLATYPDAGALDVSRESWEVYVPDAYEPEQAYGLLVWVSPSDYGGLEHDSVLRTLDGLRLIGVAANRSGNSRARWDRIALALQAATELSSLYHVDPERVYVGGYSGGGRIASELAFLYPEVFAGGFFFFGCNFYRALPVPDRPGAEWSATFAPPRGATLRKLKREHRFVLLTGQRDFNRAQTRTTYEAMLADGFRNVTYLEIPGATHYDGVAAEWMRRVFEALDGPLTAR